MNQSTFILAGKTVRAETVKHAAVKLADKWAQKHYGKNGACRGLQVTWGNDAKTCWLVVAMLGNGTHTHLMTFDARYAE